jgi:hypothetical protein
VTARHSGNCSTRQTRPTSWEAKSVTFDGFCSPGIEARLADTGQDDLKKHVVRFYKPTVVKDFVKSMVRDRALQTKQTAAVRQAIVATLGDNLTFASFNVRIPREKFIAALESTCEQNATDAHNTYVAESKDRPRILGVSVIDRLNREYGGNPEGLRSYVIGILAHAKNYLRFNGNEEGRRGPGTFGSKMSALTIILPDSQELPEFRETLRREFSQNAQIAAKEVVKSAGRQSEITLVSLTNLFPARCVEDVSYANERVLALDGVAIIVQEANPLDNLMKDEVAAIFAGAATARRWNVYARDDRSGTYETFRDRVLGSRSLVGTARRFEDSRALTTAVSQDRDGIGFVGLPYAAGAKVLAIGEKGATFLIPNTSTIRTEAYPLSRRLYF